ncbi:MAG TPA: glycoside hydrolase family 172 protein [Bacteroidota bacterium]|nr:glycoside hydrolase family 172 protein [Bacteroidota bacterium]
MTPRLCKLGIIGMFMLMVTGGDVMGQSLDNILSPSRLPYLKNSRLYQISSYDHTGGNADYVPIAAGGTAYLADIPGPGVIVQFWVTIGAKDPYFLRRLLLRMYWDGEANPSVEVPIGDFFGTGFQYKHFVTPYIGMSSGGYYSYFPMPFQKSARIEVVNQTGAEVNSFYYHIDYQKLDRPLDPDVAYFHSQWHRDVRTKDKSNYVVLDAEGEGHFVGLNMSMQSYDGGLSFLEGDEMVYVDGETQPSMYGTGTEDYFTSGWYFNHGEFAAPYHGLILKDDTLGKIAAYRFQIQDAVPFKKSIRFTIEHGHANAETADYSSTAYWYQKEPHRKFDPILPAAMRIPLRVAVPNGAIEAESLKPEGSGVTTMVEDMSAFGADWSGGQQLRVSCKKAGDSFLFNLPGTEPRYDIAIYYSKGPWNADLAIMDGEKELARIEGYSGTTEPGGKVVVQDVKLRGHSIPLKFVVTGKNPKSSAYEVGLDAFVLEPRRTYIPEWYVIGPFLNPLDAKQNRLGLDTPYPPETNPDVTKSYPGAGQKPATWKLVKTPPHGNIDLTYLEPNELVVAYAMTHIYSPKEQTVLLFIGTDDGGKVLLNDKEVFRKLVIRGAGADQDTVALHLSQGWNKLVMKIENNYGGFGFFARVRDDDESLLFDPLKKK